MKSFSIAAIMAAAAFAGESYTTTYRGGDLRVEGKGIAIATGTYTWHPDMDEDGNEIIYTSGSATFYLQGQEEFEHLDQAEVWFCLDDDKVCENNAYLQLVTAAVSDDPNTS